MEWRLADIHDPYKETTHLGEGLLQARPLGSDYLDDWGGVCDNWITTKTLDLVCELLGFQKVFYSYTQSYLK